MSESHEAPSHPKQRGEAQHLGLELFLQRPDDTSVKRIPDSRDADCTVLYPEVDADGDHVHFEMVPMDGDSLLWLTIRRKTSPQLAASSLRKVADLIERNGTQVLNLLQGNRGAFDASGGLTSGPVRMSYDENGDLVIPEQDQVTNTKSHATEG